MSQKITKDDIELLAISPLNPAIRPDARHDAAAQAVRHIQRFNAPEGLDNER